MDTIQTQWDSNGIRRQLDGDLKAKWDKQALTAERISVTLAPVTEQGAGISAVEPIRWSGRGRYDLRNDELVIESTTQSKVDDHRSTDRSHHEI